MIAASTPAFAAPARSAASVPEPPLDLSRPRRVHVIGVGGPGMSAIALALAEMGHAVSGVDIRDRPVLDR
ncbi:MAG TPA: Mur ligase domain-containing protein, partial [Ilumatobacter sp.]